MTQRNIIVLQLTVLFLGLFVFGISTGFDFSVKSFNPTSNSFDASAWAYVTIGN